MSLLIDKAGFTAQMPAIKNLILGDGERDGNTIGNMSGRLRFA